MELLIHLEQTFPEVESMSPLTATALYISFNIIHMAHELEKLIESLSTEICQLRKELALFKGVISPRFFESGAPALHHRQYSYAKIQRERPHPAQ